MRKVIFGLFTVIFVFALVIPASAQDMMEDKVVCDSTLITLLLVAEGSYGYHDMDTSVYDKGQFAPLFDNMMAMMEDSAMMDEGEMMDDSMAEEGDMMMGDDMMMLSPGTVTDEPMECTELRTSVESFLYDQLSTEFGMMDDSM